MIGSLGPAPWARPSSSQPPTTSMPWTSTATASVTSGLARRRPGLHRQLPESLRLDRRTTLGFEVRLPAGFDYSWRNSPSASPGRVAGWAYKASTAAPALRALRRTGLAAAAGRAPLPGLPGAAPTSAPSSRVQQLQCLCPGRRPARRQLQGRRPDSLRLATGGVPSRSQRRAATATGRPRTRSGRGGRHHRRQYAQGDPRLPAEFGWPADGYPTRRCSTACGRHRGRRRSLRPTSAATARGTPVRRASYRRPRPHRRITATRSFVPPSKTFRTDS